MKYIDKRLDVHVPSRSLRYVRKIETNEEAISRDKR